MLTPGEIVDNRFEIVSLIGTGGFGTVVTARQLHIDRLVAIKFLKMTLLDVPDGLARFEREAKAINALSHKNIVAFYGFGSWNDAPYLVTELADGQNLEAVLAQGILPQGTALAYFHQICLALDYAHRQGVVHRDLKPSNIMVVKTAGGEETVKLIDFGLVKLMPQYGVVGQKLTETGYALGSCHYMAPEQAQGIPVDPRADIYSLGCIMQQALTGSLPFDAADNIAIMVQHVNDPVPRLAKFLNDSAQTKSLQILLDNCLAKDPSERYQDCSALAADLRSVLTERYDAILPLSKRPFKNASRAKLQPSLTRRVAYAGAVLSACAIGSFYCLGMWREPQVVQNSANFDDRKRAFVDRLADQNGFSLTEQEAKDVELALALNPKQHKLTPEQVFRLSRRLAETYRIRSVFPKTHVSDGRSKEEASAAKVEAYSKLALAQKYKISPKQLEERSAEVRLTAMLAEAQLTQHRSKDALNTLRIAMQVKNDKSCKCWTPSEAGRDFIRHCLDQDDPETARSATNLMSMYAGADDKSEFAYQTCLADILMFEHQYAAAASHYKLALKHFSTEEVSAYKRSLIVNKKRPSSVPSIIIDKMSALTRIADAEFLLHHFASADKIADQVLNYEADDSNIEVFKPFGHLYLLRLPAAIASGDRKRIEVLLDKLDAIRGREVYGKAKRRETQELVAIVIDHLGKAGLTAYAETIDDQWMPHPITDE